MASFPPQCQHTGNAQQEQHSQTSLHSLWGNYAASNILVSSLVRPAEAFDIVLEGHTFFKADPVPGTQETWTRAERTPMLFNQTKLNRMMRKRAFKISAAQQYIRLDGTLRRQINKLVRDRKLDVPDAMWTCVYAKTHTRSFKARNVAERDRETVALDVILMRRPVNTGPYPTSPMGDLVDLTVPLNTQDGES